VDFRVDYHGSWCYLLYEGVMPIKSGFAAVLSLGACYIYAVHGGMDYPTAKGIEIASM
jgi:hypothetical protein